jgi:thymidylate kinase
MLIILEGPDKSGKTTLFNMFKERFKDDQSVRFYQPSEYKIFIAQDPDFLEKSFYGDWIALFEFLEQTTAFGNKPPHYIFDRCFISEIIYAPIVGRYIPEWFSEREKYYIDKLSKFNHCIFLLRNNRNIPDEKWDFKTLKKIQDAYEKFYYTYRNKLFIIPLYLPNLTAAEKFTKSVNFGDFKSLIIKK